MLCGRRSNFRTYNPVIALRRDVFRNDGTAVVRRANRRHDQRIHDWQQWAAKHIRKSERGQVALDTHFGLSHNLPQAQRQHLMLNNLRYREWAFILLEQMLYHPPLWFCLETGGVSGQGRRPI